MPLTPAIPVVHVHDFGRAECYRQTVFGDVLSLVLILYFIIFLACSCFGGVIQQVHIHFINSQDAFIFFKDDESGTLISISRLRYSFKHHHPHQRISTEHIQHQRCPQHNKYFQLHQPECISAQVQQARTCTHFGLGNSNR